MIKNIFLPDRIGSRYIFSRRVIGIDIGKSIIHACKLHMSGESITIESCLEERIAHGEPADYGQRVGRVLSSIVGSMGKYDSICTALDSSRIIFKRLHLPFSEREKIKKVVYFEVEPLLPFPLHDAVIDFIVVDQDSKTGKSEVIVAAVLHDQLESHLQLFVQAGLSPERVTVDLFALYGLYKSISSYAKIEGDVALVDLGVNATRIAYIHEGRLNFIRTLHKGISSIAKVVATHEGISTLDALKKLMRSDFSDQLVESKKESTDEAFAVFLDELSFTLRSFGMQTREHSQKILILGSGSEISGIDSYIANSFKSSCELFSINELVAEKRITVKGNSYPSRSSIISLAAAYPSSVTEDFNLRQDLETERYISIVNMQIISALTIVGVLFFSLLSYHFLQIRRLSNEYRASELQAIKVIKKRMPDLAIKGKKLKVILDNAKTEIASKERQVELMDPARTSYLEYLLELTEKIDKKTLGFEVKSIVIDDDTMSLKARVSSFDALRKFEDSLGQSELFEYTDRLETPDFEVKIGLVKNSEGF